MAESMSITAWLSAHDGMSGAFSKAFGSSEKLSSALKRLTLTGAGMQVGMSAVQKGMSLISESMDGAIKRFDTLNNYSGVMENIGLDGDKAAAKLKGMVSDKLTGLPTTLDSAASSITRFATKTKDIDKSADYFLAVNNALLAGGQSMSIQETALEQLSQAYSKGKPDMVEWKSLLTAMPGQISQIAKAMGTTEDALGEGLRNGDISMEAFMDTIVKLNKKGVKGFKNFEDQAKSATGGIATNIASFKTAVVRGITGVMDAIDEKLAGDTGLPFHSMGEGIKMASTAVNNGFKKINAAVSGANIKGFLKGIKPYFTALGTAVKAVTPYIVAFFKKLNEHAETIGKVLPVVMGLASAFSALRVISMIAGPMSTFVTALAAMAKSKALALLPGKLLATGAAEAEAGAGAAVAAPNMIRLGAGVLMIGAGIALACAGLTLLAQSAIALASSGGTAIAVMFGMVGAIAALMVIVAVCGPALTAGAVGMIAFGAAALMAGAGVALVGVGAMLIAKSVGKIKAGAAGAAAGLKLFALALTTLKVSAAVQVAAAMKIVSSSLKKGAAMAKPLGANLSKGFAQGMKSALSSIKKAADQIVKQAERVIKAKAKIHSPSRLTKKLGNYFGEGFAIGIEDMAKAVGNSAASLVSIPQMAMASADLPTVQASYSDSRLSDEYVYGSGNQIIEVPLYINSREFAKATSDDMDAEINAKSKRSNRKRGKV